MINPKLFKEISLHQVPPFQRERSLFTQSEIYCALFTIYLSIYLRIINARAKMGQKEKQGDDLEQQQQQQSAQVLASMQQRKENQRNQWIALHDWVDRLVMEKKRFFTVLASIVFVAFTLGVYVGDWNSEQMPGREQGQWCAMQAKECKRQADVCLVSGGARARESQPMIGMDKEKMFMEGGDIGGTDFDGVGVPQHIQQMHSEWTQSRDNRASTVARLKELRVNLLCHEIRVQQQRLKGAKDYDRINSFMGKAGKAREEYEKLEAVVKVVYPEVIPEVEELDQMKNPDCRHVHGGKV
jgi:hypothetical protein